MNEDFVFDSIDLIVSNSNYQPDYLKKAYVIEFYKILRKIEQKLKAKK